MSTDYEKRLLQWLQDAYAMEQEAETMMKAFAGRLENYPDLRQRVERHVEETRLQADRIGGCIERLGGSLPTAKSLFASLMAQVHATGNAMMSDEVVKGVGISYAFENMEVTSYRALIVAAREAGHGEIATVCENILAEEQAMADWLLEHHTGLVKRFLQREAAEGVTAKR